MDSWLSLELIKPLNGSPNFLSLLFHLFVSIIILVGIILMAVTLGQTRTTPTPPIGWNGRDYDADQGKRKSLREYLTSKSLPDSTPMNQFSVATASFGGIFTENPSGLNPWIGAVSPEAARLQVEAGARGLILDVWPDPNTRVPVVCSMIDNQAWTTQWIWSKWGLSKGVGRYSNWNKLTRNTAPVASIIQTALKAAFMSSPGTQNTDPFFLILKLHGGMTVPYLDNLGDLVRGAIGGNAMGADWNRCANQKNICSVAASQFLSRVFLIVIPDINPNYNILPNISTNAAFTTLFLTTRLGEITNALEQIPNTMFFEPSGNTTISAPSQPACGGNPGSPQQSRAQTSLCIIQPTTGGITTSNSEFYSTDSYDKCLQSGAQFVALNFFPPDSNDGPLTSFFDPNYFGTYSFRKI
jgi:hypothetical protein